MSSMGWRELVVLLWRRRELIVSRGAMAARHVQMRREGVQKYRTHRDAIINASHQFADSSVDA